MKFWRTPLDADQMEIPTGEVVIKVDRCKGCKFCGEWCPKDVLVMSSNFNAKGYHYPEITDTSHCVNCNLCNMLCPEFAIWSKDAGNGKVDPVDLEGVAAEVVAEKTAEV